jgi:hypothetical protein
MARYLFNESAIFHRMKGADPQRLGDALETIAAENDGRLTPRAMVVKARARGHPLHPHFEWNDKKAADAHRLQQARQIVHAIRVVDETQPEAPPRIAYLSIAEGDRTGFAYRPRSAVEDSARLQRLVLEQAEKDLASWERRYSEIAGDLTAAIALVRGELAERRARLVEQYRLLAAA